MDGYQHVHNRKCVTIFSAPNYCYRYFVNLYFFKKIFFFPQSTHKLRKLGIYNGSRRSNENKFVNIYIYNQFKKARNLIPLPGITNLTQLDVYQITSFEKNIFLL